ncbi:Flp pilus assembly protein CpaB [Roseibacterium sp. SDUM158017]|uniref:Flp pilus assembly protein CpaB n=1 Tax=Roseicyclus salinarum TaxID=3036773 RepID=UPI0024155500|nr:Flp pilus assembly protein CpaB [Roseibacterium sp. SDUM158017]MDG4648246.1 Flp pilus assembly protein CpaB [Roseibacterium sp. SDUM158017]
MRIIFVLVLMVGVGLAAFAVTAAKDRFDQYQAALAQQSDAIVPTTDVFIVTRQIRYGEPLRQEDVRAIRWPADHVPFGAFTSAEDLFPSDTQEPRIVLRMMEASEPILISKVTAPGEDAGVASRLEAGMRALALRVDVTSGVSGFLRPGDRVDVYWTGNGRDGERVTRLIRSNVQIIAIDQIADEDRNNPTIARTITVMAAPGDIGALTQAQASGGLTLALVGVGDESISDAVEVSTSELLGAEEVVQSTAPQVCTVRARRGGEVVVTQVPCTN